jgi:Eukaryotic aspartyl protease
MVLLAWDFNPFRAITPSPPFQTLISDGVVTSQVFGFKFATSGSELFLGGTNSALYTGDFTWVSLTIEVCSFPRAIICSVASADTHFINRATGKRLSKAFL